MSAGAIFIICVFASFPLLILVAFIVKMVEVHKAKRWLVTEGKVLISRVERVNATGNPKFQPTSPVTNEPLVEYEYVVDGQKHRCRRISIGEKIPACELESTLAKYPVGAKVTVYYDPGNPDKALLERDLPMGMMMGGLGCLMLLFVGGPILAVVAYFNGLDYLRNHVVDPKKAPFVAAATGFGILVCLFGVAFLRMIRQAARWPVARGRIIHSGVEELEVSDIDSRRTHYRSSVVYNYKVNGHEYSGDVVTLGVTATATIQGMARSMSEKYPVGSTVDVHYNPKAPSESALQPYSRWHYLIWLIGMGMFLLAWAVATGRM